MEPRIRKVPDMVNMLEFADRKMKRPDGNSPLKLTKAELRERRQRNPDRHVHYRPEQVPEFNPTTFRKRECPVCLYSNGRLMATCYRCRTCYACGSFAGQGKEDRCQVCGNFNSSPEPETPTIIIG